MGQSPGAALAIESPGHAVGRRGHFLKGRSLPRFKQCRPLRKCAERGCACATPKAGAVDKTRANTALDLFDRVRAMKAIAPSESVRMVDNAVR